MPALCGFRQTHKRVCLFLWLKSMATVITDLDDFISYVNTLYNSSSTPPSSGEEDYLVWTSLANVSVNVWENEEGMLWNELFVKLVDAPDGTKTTSANTYSYSCPTLFRFPVGGYVWIGTGASKIPYKIIKAEEKHLHENDLGNWCYFLMDGSPTLEFNPNITILGSQTINYEYYKKASSLSTGTDTFEMSDPMFAVYYTLAELKKEEGNSGELAITSQKLEGMKTRNMMPSWYGNQQFINQTEPGFGV